VTSEPIRVAILADDLIWASRLADAVSSAGGSPRRARRVEDLGTVLEQGTRFAIVDLTALAYDGVEAVVSGVAAGARVVAVGQHDDVELRKRALAAGAERVYAYRKLFEAGPDVLQGWLASAAPDRRDAGMPAGAAS
jgi:ActR/RegA family two-component response regulator